MGEPARTVPRLLLDRVARTPHAEAFRHPSGDDWTSVSWTEVAGRVTALAAGLIGRGIRPGAHVAVCAATSYEWILADLAIVCAGAVTVPVYPATPPTEVVALLRHSGSVLTFTDRPLPTAPVLHLDRLGELEAEGRRLLAADPGAVAARIAGVTPDHLATLIYTSASDGTAKGACLPHAAVTYEARAMASLGMLTPSDLQLLWLPLSHVFGRALLFVGVHLGVPTIVDGRADRVVQHLGEVRPTFLGSVPHVLGKIRAGVESGAADLGRLRFVISGSARLDRPLAEWFEGAGVPALEGYGLTETAGPCCVNRPDSRRLGSMGRPLPGTQVRIAADGELLVRSPAVMSGYHDDAERTAAVLDRDGWFHTGDRAVVDDDGFVTLRARKKEVFKTSTGKYVAPVAVARRFRALLPGADLVVVGEHRPYCVGLVVPTSGRAIPPAEAAAAVARLNAELGRWERIRRFTVLPAPLPPTEVDAHGHPLRERVLARCAEVVRRLYEG
ncbi:long-chain fatty acid--CoA ligase [Rhodococcus sp. DMU1]|uniref:AMP-dependent synthetase/ligase n=1 Tax=Rhodococcus TaxID=1827 RepID=UPI00143E34F5|nr:AMP-binding protein [Rhodococcus sp. DMU1]QIX51121.1 long-chain fatty acid--CoA ligase [Rhodococcus sp. DMU1]